MTDSLNAFGAQSLVDTFLKATPFRGDWLKAGSASPLNFYSAASRQVLAATARQLQIQADYLAKLSACDNPADVLAAQTELVQKSVGSGLESGRQITEVVSKGFQTVS